MSNSTPGTPTRLSRLKKQFSLENFTKRFGRRSPRHQSSTSSAHRGSNNYVNVDQQHLNRPTAEFDQARLNVELQEFEVCELLNNGKSPGKERRVVVVMEHMGDSPKTALKSQVRALRYGGPPTPTGEGKENFSHP